MVERGIFCKILPPWQYAMLSKLNVLRAIQFYSLENHFFVHDFWNHVQDIKRKEKKKKIERRIEKSEIAKANR